MELEAPILGGCSRTSRNLHKKQQCSVKLTLLQSSQQPIQHLPAEAETRWEKLSLDRGTVNRKNKAKIKAVCHCALCRHTKFLQKKTCWTERLHLNQWEAEPLESLRTLSIWGLKHDRLETRKTFFPQRVVEQYTSHPETGCDCESVKNGYKNHRATIVGGTQMNGPGPDSCADHNHGRTFSERPTCAMENQRTSSVADPGCLPRIPDPDFTHPGSWIQKQQQKRGVEKN